jgi:hypothetical protein
VFTSIVKKWLLPSGASLVKLFFEKAFGMASQKNGEPELKHLKEP